MNQEEYAKHLAAVEKDSRALEFVPEELRTPEIYLAAVTEFGYALELIPEEFRTPEICLAAVTNCGYALIFVPKELRTPEIYLAAVTQSRWVFEWVPKALKAHIKEESQSGTKCDAGKLRWDLIPWEQVEDVVAVLTHGSNKYSDNNWKFLDNSEDRFFAASLRHLMAWRSGYIADAESGLPHLAHAICGLLFLMHGNKT